MRTRTEQTEETPALFFWVTFFTLLFLFLSGYGLISIIHFALEDALFMPLSNFFATELFGFEYATFLSYGLILSVMFLAGDFYTRYRLKRNPKLFAQPERRALFAVFFAVISYVFCIDLISIFYGFLSGRTGPLGLWLSVSTLILSTLTLGYIYIQVYAQNFLISRAFGVITASFVALGMVCGTWLTIAYAPPWTMAKADQDRRSYFYKKRFPKTSRNIGLTTKRSPKNSMIWRSGRPSRRTSSTK